MKALLVILISAALSGPSAAAQLEIDLKSKDGPGVADAVVTFTPAKGIKGPWRLNTPREMAQEHITFKPHVLVVPVGADVTFPNRDNVRHHVYSFSKAKRFELKLYGQEQTRSVHFDTAGLVSLGCNIHDRMSGFIDVVDTPYAAKSDGAGHVTLSDIPNGPGTLTVWAETLKTPQNVDVQPLTINGDAHKTIVLDVRPAMAGMAMSGY